MGIEIGHYPEEARIDLTLEGNLDLTLSAGILFACSLVDRRVEFCAIDATRIVRVFDSGIGLLMLLFDRLRDAGVTPILVGELPGLPASVTCLLTVPPSGAFQFTGTLEPGKAAGSRTASPPGQARTPVATDAGIGAH